MITNPTDDSLASPLLGAPSPITNPHLAALDRSYSALPDDTKDVVNRAHEILGLRGPQSAAAVQTAATQPAGAPGAPEGQQPIAPPLSRISGPEENPMPGMVGVTPGMTAPAAQPLPGRSAAPSSAAPPMSRFTSPAEDTLSSAQTKGSGIQQIQSPWARVPLQILDAIGSGLFPRLAAGIPGTQAHHQQVVSGLENQVGQEQKEQAASDVSNKSAASTAAEGATAEHTRAETGAIPSTIAHTQAQTEAILHPQPKEEMEGKTLNTDQGIFQWNPKTERYDIKAGDQPATKDTGTVHTLADGSLVIAHPNGTATAVTLNGAPVKGNVPAKTTSPEQQFLDEYKTKNPGSSIADAEKAFKAIQPPERPEHAPQAMVIDSNGVAQLVRPGSTVGPGSRTVSGVNQETTAGDKKTQAKQESAAQAQDAYETAQELAKDQTGASDVGLVMQFIGAVKPESMGKIRFTPQEQNFVMGTRSSFGDLESLANKVANGQKLIPSQRQEMLRTMKVFADAASRNAGTAQPKSATQAPPAEPARPKDVPAEAKFNPANRHWEVP